MEYAGLFSAPWPAHPGRRTTAGDSPKQWRQTRRHPRRPQMPRGRRRISPRRPNRPARKANGPARQNPGHLPDVKFATFYSSAAEPPSPPNVRNSKQANVPKVKRDESAFAVDIHLHSTRFTALLSEILIYAEYEISRT